MRKSGSLGNIRVFPQKHPAPPLRTHEETAELAKKAAESGKTVMGVKGISRLFFLPIFDAIKGMVPETMHSVWIGVVRQVVKLWMTDTRAPHYLGNKWRQIDAYLLVSKIVDELKRAPRSLKLRANFKAIEFRNFALFFSPVVLKKFLPTIYFKHWLLLVNGMRILFKKEIPVDKKHKAINLINSFVLQVPKLYGVENSSYNLHLLIHVVEYIDRWGAPWAYSGFQFEHLGGLLVKLFHGTTDVPKQIMSNFQAVNTLRAYAHKHLKEADENVKSLYDALGFAERQETPYAETMGKGHLCQLDGAEMRLTEKVVDGSLTCHNAISYSRLLVRGKLFSTASYDQKFAHCNSIVSKQNSSCYEIVKILVLLPSCTCQFDGICNLRRVFRSRSINLSECNIVVIADSIALKHDPIIDDFSGFDLTTFMPFIDESVPSERVGLKPEELEWKCVRVKNENATFIIVDDLQFERG